MKSGYVVIPLAQSKPGFAVVAVDGTIVSKHPTNAEALAEAERLNMPGMPEIVRLAAGLLCIAYHAMTKGQFQNDSRCVLAREILRRHGCDPDQFGAI